ncbi:T9SS-dependent choice-of-anchor J family protein [Flavobacterium sp. MK4S-17]|uniref:T9SS-dependent choice-of-anchor J family protein n=1 Tax=Flavobacterium sp. MK4S-17 TaxID=2543737 RepID=UPI00135C772E|nr:T9SS type A sorting domain-containing protein [Flavobacterium sp. MK4S-17]
MKKITLFSAFALMFLGVEAKAQSTITVIDPAGDGGFENADTFEGNGWDVQNASYGSRKWQVGSAQPGYNGDRCAFIGASPTSVGTNAGGRTVHFYRQITLPDDAANMQLTFKYKQEVVFIDPSTGPNDYLYLSLTDDAPSTGNTPSSSQFGERYPTTGALADFTEINVPLPAEAAGGTKYLVFTFRSNNLNDPSTVGWGAIDDIELTYEGTMGTGENTIKGFSYYPNPVNNVLNLTAQESITGIRVTNLLGQQVMQLSPGSTGTAIDTSLWAKGTYMVTVTAGSSSKTVKVVK